MGIAELKANIGPCAADPTDVIRLREKPDSMPEKLLWLSVIHRAMADAVDPRSTGGGDVPHAVQHYARIWFFSDDTTPGSFRWTADAVGFSSGEIASIVTRVRKAVRVSNRYSGRTSALEKRGGFAAKG